MLTKTFSLILAYNYIIKFFIIIFDSIHGTSDIQERHRFRDHCKRKMIENTRRRFERGNNEKTAVLWCTLIAACIPIPFRTHHVYLRTVLEIIKNF